MKHKVAKGDPSTASNACPICNSGDKVVGVEDPFVYDGVGAWYCTDCRICFPRKGMEDLFKHFKGKQFFKDSLEKIPRLTDNDRELITATTKQLGDTLLEGASKYAPDSWRTYGAEAHVQHAMDHLLEYAFGNDVEDNLSHALCRIAMAKSLDKEDSL